MYVLSLNRGICTRTPPAGGVIGEWPMSCALGLGVVVGTDRRSASRRMWPILAVTSLVMSSAAPALSLRLDTDLTTTPGSNSIDAATAQLIRFGVSDMQRRSLETRQRTAVVRAENHVLQGQIEGTEELIARMQDLSGAQERTIEVLKSGIAWQQTVQASVRARVSEPPVSPPSPEASTAKPAPLTQAPAQPPVRQGSGHMKIAGFEVPNWLLGGVVGALISAVLAWLLVLVSRRRQNAAGLVAASDASTHGTASGDERTDADVLRELWDDDHGVENQSGEQTTSPVVAAATYPVSGDAPSSADAGASMLVDDVPGNPADGSDNWSRTMVSRKAADPQALKEVDTLIAFEEFDKAKTLLDQMLAREPDNPEYMLRHYHVRTQGGIDTTADDAEVLKAMMDGPMSDTLLRVREIGRGLMPGDPLFDDNAQREEAVQVLKQSGRDVPSDTEDELDFMQTIVLDPGDAALQGSQRRTK